MIGFGFNIKETIRKLHSMNKTIEYFIYIIIYINVIAILKLTLHMPVSNLWCPKSETPHQITN